MLVHIYISSTVAVPVVMADSTTVTSISLSWPTGGSEGVSYIVVWQRDTSGGCSDVDQGNDAITDGSTNYGIVNLEEGSSYSIEVTASNAIGNETSETITEMTLTAGEIRNIWDNTSINSVVLLSAPTSAPESVITPSVTSSTITVQWGMVPCIHQNGPITGYSVRYGVMGSGSTRNKTVSGASETETMISDLIPSTTYDVQVAGINGNGTGVYSSNKSALTQGITAVLLMM